MSNIEDLVRESLRQRAEDVDATPALWGEVDRRIARRRRVQVAVWSVAGATALVAAAFAVPALLDGPDPTPEVEPMPPGPEQGTDDPIEDPAPDDPTEAGDQTDRPDDGPVDDTDTSTSAAPVQTEPLLVANERSIDVVGEDGRVSVLEMDAEGESWIMGLAVRPGSTATDYTAAVLTTAEGFWDLRHLHVVDGEVVTWEVFPEPQHRPHLSQTAIMGASVSGPVFSPDGTSLAWIEDTPDGVALQTIGWADGPGTGDPARDNARFDLEPGLRGFELMDWVPAIGADDGTTHWLRLASADAGPSWVRVPLERQADDAWTMSSGATAQTVPESGDATVAAVAGSDADGRPEWLLRLGSDSAILTTGPAGEYRTYPSLPDELLPGEGLPTTWIREVGDAALVGSPNTSTAYLVDTDGNVGRVEGEVSWAAPIR